MEDLNEIFADFPSHDMTGHSILTNETLTSILKSAFSYLSFQKKTIVSSLMEISKFWWQERGENVLENERSHDIWKLVLLIAFSWNAVSKSSQNYSMDLLFVPI